MTTSCVFVLSQCAPSKRHVLLHNIDPLRRRSGTPLYNNTFDSSVSAAVRVGHMKLITGYMFPNEQVWGGSKVGKDYYIPGESQSLKDTRFFKLE